MITSLQIGSAKPEGMYREPHWVNVDLVRHRPRPRFAIANALDLPFPRRRFSTVHAIHVLEHIPRGQKDADGHYSAHVQFLRECARVVTSQGSIFVEVPDFIEGMRLLVAAADAGDPEGTRIRIVGAFGKGRHAGDKHEWGFTPWYLADLFAKVGLQCERSSNMISGHFRQEPVILMRAWHG